MDNYVPMSTTDRHNEIINTFVCEIFPLKKKKEIRALSEQCALVYWGRKSEPASLALVDVSEIENISRFTESAIEYLDYVQPDFMLFDENPYLKNSRGLRTAGRPDLILEVWSEGNTKNDKAFLQNLYATSPMTEHWYMEQDSNDVQCYLGKMQIAGQSLKNVLVTQKGLEFDLRYLAI